MTPYSGQVVDARDVVPGDRIILPMLGMRVVLDVDEWEEETGPDPGPRITIVYGLGRSWAFENSSSKGKHPAAITQPEAGLKPLKPDERVAIERRAG